MRRDTFGVVAWSWPPGGLVSSAWQMASSRSANEDGSVSVVFNGELFDYIEQRAELESRGHRFVTHCDTEILPHLWEDSQERHVPPIARPIRGRFVG